MSIDYLLVCTNLPEPVTKAISSPTTPAEAEENNNYSFSLFTKIFPSAAGGLSGYFNGVPQPVLTLIPLRTAR
jgi:hypothetical protein